MAQRRKTSADAPGTGSAKKRICECCGAEYYPSSSSQKYCTKCRLVDAHLTLTKRKTLPRRDWELPLKSIVHCEVDEDNAMVKVFRTTDKKPKITIELFEVEEKRGIFGI